MGELEQYVSDMEIGLCNHSDPFVPVSTVVGWFVGLKFLLNHGRRGKIVLDHETCDWVIDEERDTAICRTHGEVADGPKSAHFPGALTPRPANDSI